MSFEDFCSFNNIVVCLDKNIGTHVRGFCYHDGTNYVIFLNNRFDRHQLGDTMIHEIIHIMENHFVIDRSNYLDAEQEVDLLINTMKISFT